MNNAEMDKEHPPEQPAAPTPEQRAREMAAELLATWRGEVERLRAELARRKETP